MSLSIAQVESNIKQRQIHRSCDGIVLATEVLYRSTDHLTGYPIGSEKVFGIGYVNEVAADAYIGIQDIDLEIGEAVAQVSGHMAGGVGYIVRVLQRTHIQLRICSCAEAH